MKLLLDTHTFLWFINGSPQLSDYGRHLIEDESNERFVSIASLWEMSIKASLGKLLLNFSFADLFHDHIIGNAIEIIHILPQHLEILLDMPFHHKDPFDRLIISQGISEDLQILSRDKTFDKYAVQRIWK